MSENEAAPAEATPIAEVQTDQAAPAEQITQEAAPETEAKEPDNKGSERLKMRFSELTGKIRAAEERAERAEQRAREVEYQRQQSAQHDDRDPSELDAERVYAVVQKRMTEEQAQKAQNDKVNGLRDKLFESGLEGAQIVATGDDNIPVTFAMVDALAVSENPALVADHLGRNPQEAKRIAAMPESLQGYELARLESRLASLPRTTTAPPPVNTVGARAAVSDDPRSMSMEQYIAARGSGRI